MANPLASAKCRSRSDLLAKRCIRSLRLALFVAAGSCPAAGYGQSVAIQQARPGEQNVAIVVTAQRRPERAEDVPISLTAMSGRQLDRMQATEMAALGKVVPSLVMTRTSVFTQPFIRGVGKRSNLGVENSVATYVDGIYLASPISALLDLRGIDRIEVLNGPQGTLFGRNAAGGVIQVITRDPSPEPSGEITVHAGTYDYFRADSFLTGGSDQLAGNLAMSLSSNGGYGKNLATGRSELGKVDHSFVGRSKWILQPSDALKFTLAADYQDVNEDFSLVPAAGFPAIGRPLTHRFYATDEDASNRSHFRYGGVSMRADADIGGTRLTTLTAFRQMHASWSLDLDVGPLALFSATPDVRQGQFSQEFQLQSAEASRIQWVAGLYYIHIDEHYDPTISNYGGSFSALLGGRTRQTLFADGTTSSYAAYGQGTLPVGRTTSLTLGLRYTLEHRTVEAAGERLFQTAPFVRPIPGVPLLTDTRLHNSDTFDKLTWRAALDHHFSDGVMGYVSASRGFQSGGWNLQTPQNPAFGPETLDDFEGGFKFADRSQPFSASTNVFYYDYSDLQISALTPVGQATTNAAAAEIYGLELQIDARLGKATDITFGGQLLHASFKRFPNATCTDFNPQAALLDLPITCDVSGKALPFSPKAKFNLGANQEVSLGSSGTLELNGNLAYNSGYFAEPDNVVRQDAFATVDVAAEWRPLLRGPSVRVWMLNLTNAHYYNALATVQTAGVLANPAPPRRVGVSLGYAF
jgi:iron complex outermembrane receptor protein